MSHEDLTALPGNFASQAGAFLAAAEDIHRGAGGGASEAASGGGQTAFLAEWAGTRGLLIAPEAFEAEPLVSNATSEHEVRYSRGQNRAWKRTWAGFYGQIPCPQNGALGRRNATPVEYLRRMALQVSVFQSDIRLEGVSVSDKPSMIIGQPAGEPSLIVSQEWLEHDCAVTPEMIAQRLAQDDFVPVPKSYYGWYRAADGVVVVDAKADNFIGTSAGVIALDLQMAQFTPEEAAAAGLPRPQADDDTFKSHAS